MLDPALAFTCMCLPWLEASCHSLHPSSFFVIIIPRCSGNREVDLARHRATYGPMGLRVVANSVLQSGWVGFVPRLVTSNTCNNRGRAYLCYEEAPAAHVPHDLPDRQVSFPREERILLTWLAACFWFRRCRNQSCLLFAIAFPQRLQTLILLAFLIFPMVGVRLGRWWCSRPCFAIFSLVLHGCPGKQTSMWQGT